MHSGEFYCDLYLKIIIGNPHIMLYNGLYKAHNGGYIQLFGNVGNAVGTIKTLNIMIRGKGYDYQGTVAWYFRT